MNKMLTTLALLLSLGSSVTAQDQESPMTKLHRDFPNAQMILPSIPAWRFNFDTNRWERDQETAPELEVPADEDLDSLIRALGVPYTHRAGGRRHKRSHHHVHHGRRVHHFKFNPATKD
jgi:hypothetical protein